MTTAHFFIRSGLGMLACVACVAAGAQDYPNKPIRIVTGGVGGGNDVVSRLLAIGLSAGLGQQIIVDNRASSIVPGEIVVKAQPDGYNLLSYGNSIWVGQLVRGNLVLDPVRDFSPVSAAAKAPNLLVVHPSVAAKSVAELVALAKAKPGSLNYSSGATGASSHLAAELFKAMAGINIVRIPYKSGATEMTDLVGGQVQMTFGTASVMPHVKSGRLRALAVTSLKPSALYPGVVTMTAAGLPGYESGSAYGVFGPAKLPAAILRRLNQEIVRYLGTPEAQERFLNAGLEAGASTPEQFVAEVRADVARWGKVIKDAGIRDD
jgi:tripartite-type tricarboxylate transporter receptor subunit TctC